MENLQELLRFNNIFFRGSVFDKDKILDEIEYLKNHLVRNIKSPSPFVLLPGFNHIKTVIAFYAILKAGKKVILINPYSKSLELTEIIEETDPAALMLINESSLYFEYSEEIVFRAPDKNFRILSDISDVWLLLYTNAEDGYSKGAMITGKNLLTSVKTYSKIENIKDSDTISAYLPFYHILGFTYGVLMPAFAGGNVLIVDTNLIKIQQSVNEIVDYNVTNLFSVPSIYYLIGKIPDVKLKLKNVNEVVTGGVSLSPELYESFLKKTGLELREGYGLTEVTAGSITNYRYEKIKVGSIGKSFPCNEIRIVDENGNECKPGETGEICIKGDNVFKGFFNNTGATKNVFKDGWFFTGDYGKKDHDGYYYFCGLKKDMANVGGNNIYPNELKRLIMHNKNVLHVDIYKETSLIQGETLGANILLQDSSEKGQEEFKKWCYKNITNQKLPKNWNFLK